MTASAPEGIGWIVEPYDDAYRAWLDRHADHYLDNAPPGALYAVSVRAMADALFGRSPCGERLGACVIGRPVAPRLPQDGSWCEVTRFWLAPGLPYGTASQVLVYAIDVARRKRIEVMIDYHDRTKHTGCIYRKAGFRKDVASLHVGRGWATRAGRKSAGYEQTPKRRWRIDLNPDTPTVEATCAP